MKASRTADTRPSWFSRHSGALFASGFGLVFAVAGLLIVFLAVPSTRGRAAAVDALAVVSPATAAAQPLGARVLLEARIASDTPEVMRDFVAFRRREFRGWKEEGARRREQWETKEIVTPPLVLEGGSERIPITVGGYEMSGEPHRWRSTEGLEHTMFGPSTQEITGFRRGDVVTADGVLEDGALEDGAQGRSIRAAHLAGGTSDAYRESLRESVLALQIVGLVFSGVGGILFLAGLIALYRARVGM